jgi:hypothetical protein
MSSLQPLRILALSCLGCVLVPAWSFSGASTVESDSVLKLTAVPAHQTDSTPCQRTGIDKVALGVDIENQGQKPLRGFLAAIYYREPGKQANQQYELLHYQGQTIFPGKKFRLTVCDLPSDADLENVRFKVDLLAFEDKSISGPLNLPESNHIYGVIEGFDFVSGGSPVAKFVTPTPVSRPLASDLVPSGDNSLPLEFAGTVDRSHPGQLSLTIVATNKGSVPVIGYEYKISFFDHMTGAFVRSVTTKTLATTGNPSDYLFPGASWSSGARRLSVSSDGVPNDYQIKLDVVALANGKTLGPRRSKESDELLGMLQGIQDAKLFASRNSR